MKVTVAFTLLFIGAALAGNIINDRPDCSTEIHLEIRGFSYNLDPSKYWICSKVGTPAILASCPEGEIFIPNLQKCVSPSNINWDRPSKPIQKPDILSYDRSSLKPISRPDISKDDLPWDLSNLNWPYQAISKPEIPAGWQKFYQSIQKSEIAKNLQKSYQSIPKPEISKDDLPWKKPVQA